MREIAFFGEDEAHRQVVGTLVRRIAQTRGVDVRLDWRNARRGHGAVARELIEYLRDLRRQESGRRPDLIVVATDTNCAGWNERSRELRGLVGEAPADVVLALPDPHVERWLLLDGAAFKTVFGRGCPAPDQKCDRDRYKTLLIRAIIDAGGTTLLGGIERAADIVKEIDLDRAKRADTSLRHFVEDLEAAMRGWSS